MFEITGKSIWVEDHMSLLSLRFIECHILISLSPSLPPPGCINIFPQKNQPNNVAIHFFLNFFLPAPLQVIIQNPVFWINAYFVGYIPKAK